MLYRVGWLKREGRFALLESTIAKVFISESLVQTAMAAVEVHGARGYLAETGSSELATRRRADLRRNSAVQRGILAELLGVRGGACPDSSTPPGLNPAQEG